MRAQWHRHFRSRRATRSRSDRSGRPCGQRPVVVAGSLYLAGEVRGLSRDILPRQLRRTRAAHERRRSRRCFRSQTSAARVNSSCVERSVAPRALRAPPAVAGGRFRPVQSVQLVRTRRSLAISRQQPRAHRRAPRRVTDHAHGPGGDRLQRPSLFADQVVYETDPGASSRPVTSRWSRPTSASSPSGPRSTAERNSARSSQPSARPRSAPTRAPERTSSARRNPTSCFDGARSRGRGRPQYTLEGRRLHHLRAAVPPVGDVGRQRHRSASISTRCSEAHCPARQGRAAALSAGDLLPHQQGGPVDGLPACPPTAPRPFGGASMSNAFFWAINRSQDATFYHDWNASRAGPRSASTAM